ncbi:glycosyltransferase family 4 protein [Chromobacterium piscinae]|uniref:glycosyltransferase family 4 protein n=1 Tax=Chromobacterium piscinae TaxID=686831 RepID=UPI0014097DDC|nr:glycosyltransferase family 4 protein [Chromobacterium piscinae]MBX9295867.1 glycosyltransferase family 4 protein [Chromobacterium vaccinii]MBX9356064.1 glycosyltransferase family 4 protein [Chromobacterium vaccinii]MCD4505962.1 glycosyltransferase family 4 protein [Chromobacterium piscinae]MCD5327242.1 glycosyltransferase family 4 protein [Chromobacterium piscinae]NHQ82897.1 glycosyltransferase family 4 protein [Chromobacterium vaccinii]
MKILYINHYAGSPRHGMEFRPYYLAREWVQAGHEVNMLAADVSHLRQTHPQVDGKYRDEDIDGIRYTWCKTRPYEGNGIGRVLNIFSFLAKVMGLSRRYLKEWKPDVVIASSTYPLDTVPAAWIAGKTGARLVYEVHDLWPLTPVEVGGMSPKHPFIRLLQWAEDFGYKRADTVVSMLPCARDYMMAHGMAPEKYAVIPNGVDVGEWQGEALPLSAEHRMRLAELKAHGRFIVGYAGGHGLANALDYLLEAASLMRDAPVTFVLVGDGPDKEALVARAAELKLDNVMFLPSIAKRSVPAFLAECDALYIGWRKLPIYRFGINPNKLFDYMMAGKPVIHSVEAGNDMVKDAGAGLSIGVEDPAVIADAVKRMAVLPLAERDAMGAAGKAYVLANHDYAVLARRFLDAVRLQG